MNDQGLQIWLHSEHLLSQALRGVTWVVVTLLRPTALQAQQDAHAQLESSPSPRVVAKLGVWQDAPDSRHAALSTMLCAILGSEGIVGGMVRVDPAPPPLTSKNPSSKHLSSQASKEFLIKRLRLTPFTSTPNGAVSGLKFSTSGGSLDDVARAASAMFQDNVLDGPLTDGMMLPKQGTWPGAIIDFEPSPPAEPRKQRVNWLLGSDRKLELTVQPASAPPRLSRTPAETLPKAKPTIVGLDALASSIRSSLLHSSSVLLTGGLGSGKTSLAQFVAHQLREEFFYHTSYVACKTLVDEDTRLKTTKDNLKRLFASASWGARLGGHALIVFDDLDKLCPAEQELQVDANGRSRQASELLCYIAGEFRAEYSGLVLLATAQSKEAVHEVVVGGHVMQDTFALKAPDKGTRRKLLDLLVQHGHSSSKPIESHDGGGSSVTEAWTDPSDGQHNTTTAELSRGDTGSEVDLLHVAGQTDGYMPGDLALLVSRARSEALIRAAASESSLSRRNHAHGSRLQCRVERLRSCVAPGRSPSRFCYHFRSHRWSPENTPDTTGDTSVPHNLQLAVRQMPL